MWKQTQEIYQSSQGKHFSETDYTLPDRVSDSIK